MWEDSRGSTGSALRGVAHRDDAKDRSDEAGRHSDTGVRHPAGHAAVQARRLPTWAVPVGAAAAVLVIVAGTFAVTQRGSDNSATGSNPAAGSSPAANTETDGGGDDEGNDGSGAGAEGDASALVGTVTGDVTVTYTRDGGTQSEDGTITFDLDCSAGTTCSLSGWSGTGALSKTPDDVFRKYLGLDWSGEPGTWEHQGRAPANCDEGTARDPALVTGILTIDGDQVTLTSSSEEYSFKAPTYCFGPSIELAITGALG